MELKQEPPSSGGRPKRVRSSTMEDASSDKTFSNVVANNLPARYPVIISIDNPENNFNKLSFAQRTHFVKDLKGVSLGVKNTRLATRGNLFVHLVDEKQ